MKKLLCFLFVGILTFTSVSADVPEMERQVLLDLYESTNGQEWNKKWNLRAPVSNWYGVSVVDNHVVGLNLFRNNLVGIIPENIGGLQNLKILNLAFNVISGQIPESLTTLKKLQVLKLEMNRIKGTLPDSIGMLESLEELSLFNNFISGKIPQSMGRLRQLKVLNLSSNNFRGEIPKSLGDLTQLTSLGLFENTLYGDIPREMGKLIHLKELVWPIINWEVKYLKSLANWQVCKYSRSRTTDSIHSRI